MWSFSFVIIWTVSNFWHNWSFFFWWYIFFTWFPGLHTLGFSFTYCLFLLSLPSVSPGLLLLSAVFDSLFLGLHSLLIISSLNDFKYHLYTEDYQIHISCPLSFWTPNSHIQLSTSTSPLVFFKIFKLKCQKLNSFTPLPHSFSFQLMATLYSQLLKVKYLESFSTLSYIPSSPSANPIDSFYKIYLEFWLFPTISTVSILIIFCLGVCH